MTSPRDAYRDLTGKSVIVVHTGEDLQKILIGGTTEVVRRLQLRVYQTETTATPVDLGHARSGWAASIGSPASKRIKVRKTKKATKSAAGARIAKNIARSETIARSYQVGQGSVFLTNPVEYMKYLDGKGSSSQAQAGFVLRAIKAAIAAERGNVS